jgi:hypothetical protein
MRQKVAERLALQDYMRPDGVAFQAADSSKVGIFDEITNFRRSGG